MRNPMALDRHDQQPASGPRGSDAYTASPVSMRPDLVLGGASETPAAPPAPDGTGARGQGYEGGTMTVLEPAPSPPDSGVDGLRTVGAAPGGMAYLRCGACGATVALERRVRRDGRFADYPLAGHDSCGAPGAFRGEWSTGA
jgi:hypothetical protein